MWSKVKIFLIASSSMIGAIMVLSLLLFGAAMFSKELQKDSLKRQKKERMQFVRDSLQVELLKQNLIKNESTNTK